MSLPITLIDTVSGIITTAVAVHISAILARAWFILSTKGNSLLLNACTKALTQVAERSTLFW